MNRSSGYGGRSKEMSLMDAELKREGSEMRTKTVNLEEERGRSAFIDSRFSSFELPI